MNFKFELEKHQIILKKIRLKIISRRSTQPMYDFTSFSIIIVPHGYENNLKFAEKDVKWEICFLVK